MVSAGICIASLPQTTQYGIKYNIEQILVNDFTKTDKNYEYSDIVQAIEGNDKLPEKDKKFLEELLQKEFEENKEYINIPVLIDRLNTVEAEYKKRLKWNEEKGEYEITTDNIPMSTCAYYNENKNKITCLNPEKKFIERDEKDKEYDERKFDFDSVDTTNYFHEVNHLLSIKSFESNIGTQLNYVPTIYENDLATNYDEEYIEEYNDGEFLGGYYRSNIDDKKLKKLKNEQYLINQANPFYNNLYLETINELFSREYYEEYRDNHPEKNYNSTGYESDMPFMYILAELLPEDILREYKYNANICILVKGLKQINNDNNKAYELITGINNIKYYEEQKRILSFGISQEISFIEKEHDLGLTEEELEQQEIIENEIQENYKNIHDNFAYFYKKKYNKDMSNDMLLLSYLYRTPIITEEEKEKFENFIQKGEGYITDFKAKGYVSEYYKSKHPSVSFKIKNGDNVVEFEIGDNNRYQIEKNREFEGR